MATAAPEAEEVGLHRIATRFAAEFARLGYPAARILRLFHDPFYASAHAALRALGEPVVGAVVAQAVARRAPSRRPEVRRRAT